MDSPEKTVDERDQQWAREISEGNKAAFERLFFEFYYDLCDFTLSMINSREEARDVVQDVFFRIWKRRSSWKIHTSLKVYMFQAVRNEALNHIEKEKTLLKLKQELVQIPPSDVDEKSAGLDKEDQKVVARIWEIAEEMPERRQSVFVLHRKHGLSYKEVSKIMGITRKTVENHMGEALKYIRERIAGDVLG